MARLFPRLVAFACAFVLAAPFGAVARERALETLADRLAVETGFDGVMLVGDGHRVRMRRAYGPEDAGRGVAASPATRYQTGSFSKWLASVVVLRLVDDGRLSLTAPVSTYLPGYAPANGARVTLHHLMSHTSGVPNDLAAALKAAGTMAAFAGVDSRTALQRYASSPLAFAPGERFDYSHSNWLVVEAVIERVTAKPYAQVVQDEVLGPLRLRESGIVVDDFYDVPHAARGYDALRPVPKPASTAMLAPMPAFLGPVGGYYATADDVLRLLDGVYAGRVLSPASREALWRVNVPAEGYAYGGRVKVRRIGDAPHRLSWNNNSNGPYKSLIVRADDGRTVVLLNNSRIDGAALTRIAEALLGVAPADG
jgi:D-alanyl-D-alanine carboxypeptidase